MNVFTFSGNLGSDAERRSTGSGTAVLNFSVAVRSGYGDNEKTTWVRCALWGKRAEGALGDHLTKGKQVVVSGEASLDEWQKDGQNKSTLSVNVREITLVGSRPEPTQQQAQPQGQAAEPAGGIDEDLIPF